MKTPYLSFTLYVVAALVHLAALLCAAPVRVQAATLGAFSGLLVWTWRRIDAPHSAPGLGL